MYMNLKPNQHKRISFNTTTMTSLGVHSPPPLNLAPPLNVIFCSEIFRYPPKIGGGGGQGLLPCRWCKPSQVSAYFK